MYLIITTFRKKVGRRPTFAGWLNTGRPAPRCHRARSLAPAPGTRPHPAHGGSACPRSLLPSLVALRLIAPEKWSSSDLLYCWAAAFHSRCALFRTARPLARQPTALHTAGPRKACVARVPMAREEPADLRGTRRLLRGRHASLFAARSL